MRRALTTLVAALVVVSTVAAVPALGAVAGDASEPNSSIQQTDGNETDGNETNASLSPGERLTGVVGIQEAEIEGEVEQRSFGLAVARANSSEERAEIIAQKLNESRQDVDQLRERRESLREARANGSISQGQFQARMAEVNARSNNVARIANESENASEGLPTDLLEANGINATAIRMLREDAQNMTGPEVAEVARSIAGDRRPAQAEERPGPDRGDGNVTDAPEQPGEEVAGNETAGDGTTADGGPVTDGGADDGQSSAGSDGAAAGDRGGQ